jgi:hypothetical protein
MESSFARRLLCFVLAPFFLAVTSSAAAPALGARAGSALPPSGVYTCPWIAANPAAAAQAHVTCDPSGALPTSASQSLAATTPDSIEAQGCQYVPSPTTRVGKGVWGWTTYEYAGSWAFEGFYSPAYYTWYIQKTDGTNYIYGEILDTGYHSINIASNVYRWGAQNHSSTAQQWYVCYSG